MSGCLCGRSSVVEHHVANVSVVSSILIARYLQRITVDETLSPRHFSDDAVSVECTYRPGCLIEMVVTVSPTACQAAQQRALKEVRKEASLPGFRQGHVPEPMVLKHFKPQLIRKTQAVLMSTAFDAAVALTGRNPFTSNSLRKATLQKSSKEHGAEFLFVYEASPKVPAIQIEELQLSKVDSKPVPEEKVQEQCDLWRLQMKKTTPAEDRPFKEGDVASIVVSDASKTPEEGTEVPVGPRMPEWLCTALSGMRVGENKEVFYPSAEGKSQEKVRVGLRKLFDCVLPEVNDEFAKHFGKASLEEFRTSLKDGLELGEREQAQERMRRQVKNELIRLYAFDLPQSLVEKETEARFQSFWEELPAHERKEANKESLRKPFLDEVKRHFTCLFLLEPIFSTAKPTYTQRQLTEELFLQERMPPELRAVYGKLTEEEITSRLLTEVAMQQCEDYCIEQRLGIAAPHARSRTEECHCQGENETCSCHGSCSCSEEA